MGSFNNNHFIGAQLKNLMGLLIFFATLTKNGLGTALHLKQQIMDQSTLSTDDYFYESTTLDSVTTSSTSSPEYCQNVNSLCLTKECLRAASDLMYDMDLTIDPCDDFYHFTCGNWAENHPMPDTNNYFDWGDEKQTLIDRSIRNFLISNGKQSEPDAVKGARTMYKACMNTRKIDYQMIIDSLNESNLPVLPSAISKKVSKKVNQSSIDDFDWIKTTAAIRKNLGLDVIVGFDIVPGPEDKTKNHITFCILKHRELTDYFDGGDGADDDDDDKDDEESNDVDDEDDSESVDDKKEEIINKITEVIYGFGKFVDHHFSSKRPRYMIRKVARKIIEMTELLNKFVDEGIEIMNEDGEENTQELMDFDEFQESTDQLIAPKSIPIWYKFSEIMLQDISSKIDLNSSQILSDRGDLHYLQKVTKFIDETPKIDLELYIWWATVLELVTLNEKEMPSDTSEDGDETVERSLECTRKVHESLLMAVSYAMAKPNFINETKPQIENMIENIRLTFDESVKNMSWIDKKTKQLIWEKSKEMKVFVGLPKWIAGQDKLDEFYTGLHFDGKSHLRNLKNLIQWRVNRLLKTINDPESDEWSSKPTEVNAFYFASDNAITIPLAFLQYPYYNLGLDALEYGAMGSTIGHELSHGFDDDGRKYDKNGNKRKWWKNKMITAFRNKAKCFVDQYSNFHIPELNKTVDGNLTLGENIADNGGVRQAFYAYKLYSNKYGKEPKLPGFENFTHEQLFFISFGHSYCETKTPAAMKGFLADEHAPSRFRVNGVLANSDEFRSTFNCSPESKMISKNQCRIW